MIPVQIRDLKSASDMQACVALQRATWGAEFSEIVPGAILQVVQYVGGVAAGAFDQTGELVGFVFGITGIEQGADGMVPVHWSDMLAVRKDFRNHGIGAQLKRYQRDVLLARGVQKIYWSFDPLDAKNAYVNFVRLGVYAREYRIDMYGQTDSPLHHGIGTDRLIATWAIAGARPRVQTMNAQRIEVPLDIHDINARDPAAARDWRRRTRAAFTHWLGLGYVVVDFERTTASGSYLLVPPSDVEL